MYGHCVKVSYILLMIESCVVIPPEMIMNSNQSNHINNIVVGMLAHVDAGKTTLSEAMLYSMGAIRKLGRVDNKDAFFDNNALERKRGITIFSKQAQMNIDNTHITLLDTPGHVDFGAEMERTLQVLDYAILLISAADGVQAHTETLWKLLARYHIPTFIFVNKMDQAGANRQRILEQLNNRFSSSIVDFTNPDDEEIALCDETVLNSYLEGAPVLQSDIARLIANRQLFPCFFGSALRLTGIDEFIQALAAYTVMPDYPSDFGAKVFKIARDSQGNRLTFVKVTGGILRVKMQIDDTQKVNQIRVYSGDRFSLVNELTAGSIGALTGLEYSRIGDSLGSDTESVTPVLEPVLTYKLILPDDTDALVMLPKLRILEEENPELSIIWNEMLGEIQIQIMGAVQIEVMQNIIKERFGVDVSFGSGNIVYKETISNTVEGVGHFEPLKHYAEVHLLIEPAESGSGIEYALDCSEDVLDKNWQRLILTHLYERSHPGVLTGSALTDVKITLVSGRAHIKHTEGGDFRQATYRAVRQGLMQAESVLLEPVYEFTLKVPQSAVGRAMTDLERMNAVFTLKDTYGFDNTPDDHSRYSVIIGRVPVSSVGDYQTEVIAYTKGLGYITLKPGGYEPCHNADEVIAAIGYDANHDTLNPSDSVFCLHGSGINVSWDKVFEHMHMDSVLAARTRYNPSDPNYDEAYRMAAAKSGRTVSDEVIDTDEVDAILRQTYYANSKSCGSERKSYGKRVIQAADVSYKGRETSASNSEQYLLVDGYNIIHAWNELNELASINMDSARSRLQDILCNYQAMKQCHLIVVYDAYRVAGHDTKFFDYNNIHIVFTKEAETADQYIERFAHEHGRRHYVRVATSDGLEQIIIRGQGCHLVSAREFEEEVKAIEEHIRKEYLNRSY